ncbi:reverse transcriptase domain, reverse transcriptase zinc-binding domain protein [Tanacetum coccineum]
MGSGLKVNLDKSRLFGVGVPDSDVSLVASSLGCTHGILPLIYLGLPVGRRMRFSEGWEGIIDRFHDRLSLWKAKTLSVGGRLTLIKYVLGSLPVYYLSLLKAPSNVLKIYGGLGVGCLHSKNLSLLGKEIASLGSSGVWIDIIKAIKHIEGIDFNFRSSFIRKRIPPRGRGLNDINTLCNSLNVVVLNPNGRDKWSWSYEAPGCLKVNVLTKVIEFNLHGVHILGSHHKWNSWIPKKVNIVAWRASLDRLATRFNLMARDVSLPSINCLFCGLEPEVMDHVLVRCHWVASGNVKLQGGANLSKATNRVFQRISGKEVYIGEESELCNTLHGRFRIRWMISAHSMTFGEDIDSDHVMMTFSLGYLQWVLEILLYWASVPLGFVVLGFEAFLGSSIYISNLSKKTYNGIYILFKT